jgi:hypothetical protein
LIRKSNALAIVGLAGILELAACGGSGGAPSTHGHGKPALGGTGAGSKAVSAAYSATTKERTAKARFAVQAHQGSGGSQANIHVRGSGVLDFAHKDERLKLQTPAGGTAQVRRVGSSLYEKLPAQARGQIPGHKPWIKLDLNKLTKKQYGATLAQLRAGSANDPAQILGYLRGVSPKVRKVGTTAIRGTKTTHYKASVDLDKAAARKGPDAQQATKKLEQKIGTHTLPVQVWLDQQGRVRQVRMALPIPTDGSGSSKVSVTTDLYDYGTPVNIKAPPASQTTDITSKVIRHLPSDQKSSAGSGANALG